MIRRAVVLAAAVALAAPGAAQAATEHKVKQSPAEVGAYWTDERMRGAIPVKHERAVKENRAKPGSTTTWRSFEAPLTGGAYTDRRHGKVFFSDNGSNYVCSGTVLRGVPVGTTVRSIVWTAGHCTVDGGGGVDAAYDNWQFVPGYRDGVRPYGTFAAIELAYDDSWDSDLEYGHDFAAAAVVNTVPDGPTLESITKTGYDLAVNYASETATTAIGRMESHGYPAEGKFNGQRQNVCDSSVIRRDAANPDTMAINCDSNGGSSGGGWLWRGPRGDQPAKVASVNSYGYGSLRNVMFGPAQDSVATAVYTDAGTED